MAHVFILKVLRRYAKRTDLSSGFHRIVSIVYPGSETTVEKYVTDDWNNAYICTCIFQQSLKIHFVNICLVHWRKHDLLINNDFVLPWRDLMYALVIESILVFHVLSLSLSLSLCLSLSLREVSNFALFLSETSVTVSLGEEQNFTLDRLTIHISHLDICRYLQLCWFSFYLAEDWV